jgi:hypothetical protein
MNKEEICRLRKYALGLEGCTNCPTSCCVKDNNYNELMNITMANPEAFPGVVGNETEDTDEPKPKSDGFFRITSVHRNGLKEALGLSGDDNAGKQGTAVISKPCTSCGKKVTMTVRIEDVAKRANGMKVQDAFPYLSPAQREMFITGICGDCWNEMFGFRE